MVGMEMKEGSNNATYAYVNRMEQPLTAIKNFAPLSRITESIEEPGASAIEIIHAILEQVRQVDEVHALLFRAYHPNRERFQQDGKWLAGV
jgi:hypothetical protein